MCESKAFVHLCTFCAAFVHSICAASKVVLCGLQPLQRHGIRKEQIAGSHMLPAVVAKCLRGKGNSETRSIRCSELSSIEAPNIGERYGR